MIHMRPLFELSASVQAPQVTPQGPYGTRRFIPVSGGHFKGDRVSGRLLPGGADCQLIRPDGVAELDVRVPLEADDGAVILMKGFGLRHASESVMQRLNSGDIVPASAYYFRETLVFEAPAGPHEWLNRIVALAIGERLPSEVRLSVYEVT